jgi:CubicO group peptidase (beta-lactamase class C family)
VAHLPRAGDFLLYPPTVQPWGYRIVDRLFAHRVVRRGRPKPWARGAEIAPTYLADGRAQDVEAFMARNFLAGLLVVQDGRIRLERYGLGLAEGDRWTTMSTIKSWTAILLGAAIRDGAIESVEAPVTRFLPELAGTALARLWPVMRRSKAHGRCRRGGRGGVLLACMRAGM